MQFNLWNKNKNRIIAVLLAYANTIAFGQKAEPTSKPCSPKNAEDPTCHNSVKPKRPAKKTPSPLPPSKKGPAPNPPKPPKNLKPTEDDLPDRKGDRF